MQVMRSGHIAMEPVARPAPTPAELPVLVSFAKSVVITAHAKAQSSAKFMLEAARDYLEILPMVLDRAVKIDGLDRGVFWALEGTRILARTAHSKINGLLAVPEAPIPHRQELHKAIKVQMSMVLERIENAEYLIRHPWNPTS